MSQKTKCELCEKNPATVHYTEIADGRVSKFFICRECAEGRDLLEEPGVEELMSSITKQSPDDEDSDRSCPSCNIDFAQFRQRGRLGCPDCYNAFRDELLPILRQVHKHVRHSGKHPRAGQASDARWQQLSRLRQELDMAVRTEDYERAAELRDAIRRQEGDSAAEQQGPRPAGDAKEERP